MKLSEVSIIEFGQSPESKYYNTENIGLPFLQGRTTFGRKYPFYDIYTSKYNKIAEEGDILFTVRAPVGDINIATVKTAIGRGLAAIRGKNILTLYLFYLLEANKNKIKESSVGTIYESINRDELENIELKIHDISTQQHIVYTISLALNTLYLFQNFYLNN